MESQTHQSPAPDERSARKEKITTRLSSGTGAPIFEPGPHTRIRRNPTRAIAALTWNGGPREAFGQILNVSLTGCLLRTESTIAPDTELELTVTLVGAGSNEEFDIRAVVRRTTAVRGRQAYGLEFISSSTDEKIAIQKLYSETAR